MCFLQSMVGFHFFSQGMPKMICCFPRLRIMSFNFSVFSLNKMSACAFHWMVPLVLEVPSTLLVMIRWGSFSKGKSRRQKTGVNEVSGGSTVNNGSGVNDLCFIRQPDRNVHGSFIREGCYYHGSWYGKSTLTILPKLKTLKFH